MRRDKNFIALADVQALTNFFLYIATTVVDSVIAYGVYRVLDYFFKRH